jgi:uncharacterized RDD family membrane protein YckC
MSASDGTEKTASQRNRSLLGRRILAKCVDTSVFSAVFTVLHLWLFPVENGLLPLLATIAALGTFLVAADTLTASLFGATPGEWIAGLRIYTAAGDPLPWATRADRTTSALWAGTLGVISLCERIASGKPAPYDEGCLIEVKRRDHRAAMLLDLVGIALTIGLALLSFAWFFLSTATTTGAKAALLNFAHDAGLPVRQRWTNPFTHDVVVIPDGWRIGDSEYQGEILSEQWFFCGDGCFARLHAYTFEQERIISAEMIHSTCNYYLLEALGGADLGHPHENYFDIPNSSRAALVYVFDLPPISQLPEHTHVGLCWAQGEVGYGLISLLPRREAGSPSREVDTKFLRSLVHSTRNEY